MVSVMIFRVVCMVTNQYKLTLFFSFSFFSATDTNSSIARSDSPFTRIFFLRVVVSNFGFTLRICHSFPQSRVDFPSIIKSVGVNSPIFSLLLEFFHTTGFNISIVLFPLTSSSACGSHLSARQNKWRTRHQ